MLRVLLVVGTRPEAIKMAPVVRACQLLPGIEPLVVLTGQHRELVRPLVDHFKLSPALELQTPAGQSLGRLVASLISGLCDGVEELRADCIVAQGDTASVLAAAQVAFLSWLPLVHVVAGLRSGSLSGPWPEEFNRRVATLAAQVHCAPTPLACDNLLAEGVPAARIHLTGNTVIDALNMTLQRQAADIGAYIQRFPFLDQRRLVLVTAHRRESQNGGIDRVCEALDHLSAKFTNVEFVYPVHLNPHVQRAAAGLPSRDNLRPLPPLPYPDFVWLLSQASVVLTDSGGVQEEATALGKPLLVLRDRTERQEILDGDGAELVGTCPERIVSRVSARLASGAPSPIRGRDAYGDGHSGERIANLIAKRAWA